MRIIKLLLISVSAIILFFPAFWLFAWMFGTDWGAVIAAIVFLIGYPLIALNIRPSIHYFIIKTYTDDKLGELRHKFGKWMGNITYLGQDNIELLLYGDKEGVIIKAKEDLELTEKEFGISKQKIQDDFFDAYDIMADAVQSGEFSEFYEDGGQLPEIKNNSDVWDYVHLESIILNQDNPGEVMLTYRADWEIEHTYGLIFLDGKYNYFSGSV